MVASCLKTGLFNFEMHGIDLADALRDGYPEAPHQPTAGPTMVAKQQNSRAEATIEQPKPPAQRFKTLAEVADGHRATV